MPFWLLCPKKIRLLLSVVLIVAMCAVLGGIRGCSLFLFYLFKFIIMPRTMNLSKDVNNSIILTPESCSTTTIKNYFQYILTLSKSGESFPVNLEDVFYLVYNKKSDAVESLKKDEVFVQDIDYQVLRQNPQNLFGGRPKDVYKLSIPCLEYFIARKVRPVFEVYRQVFHAVPDVAMKVRADNTKIAKLEKKIESLERQIKIVQGISKYETELKCSCFSFLTYTGLYLKWEEYRKGDISKEDLKLIKSVYC